MSHLPLINYGTIIPQERSTGNQETCLEAFSSFLLSCETIFVLLFFKNVISCKSLSKVTCEEGKRDFVMAKELLFVEFSTLFYESDQWNAGGPAHLIIINLTRCITYIWRELFSCGCIFET